MRGGIDINQLHINCTNCTMMDSHTHFQVVIADLQAKTLQRVCLFQFTTDRQSRRKKNTERTISPIRKQGFNALQYRKVVKCPTYVQLKTVREVLFLALPLDFAII